MTIRPSRSVRNVRKSVEGTTYVTGPRLFWKVRSRTPGRVPAEANGHLDGAGAWAKAPGAAKREEASRSAAARGRMERLSILGLRVGSYCRRPPSSPWERRAGVVRCSRAALSYLPGARDGLPAASPGSKPELRVGIAGGQGVAKAEDGRGGIV